MFQVYEINNALCMLILSYQNEFRLCVELFAQKQVSTHCKHTLRYRTGTAFCCGQLCEAKCINEKLN